MIAKLQETLHSDNRISHFLGKKPLLAAGLGLTVGVSLWHAMIPSLSEGLGVLSWGAIAVGAGAWWFSRKAQPAVTLSPTFPDTITRETVDTALIELKGNINQFTNDLTEPEVASSQYAEAIAHLNQQHADLAANLDHTQLSCAMVGAKSVGKTALTLQLAQLSTSNPASWVAPPYSLSFSDTTAVLTPPGDEAVSSQPTTLGANWKTDWETNWLGADMIAFVSEGDITASELQIIQTLLDHRHTVVVVFNKQDRYLPAEQSEVINRIRERLNGMIDADNVVMTSAIATPIKIRSHQPDGSIQEQMGETPPDVAAFAQRLQTLVEQTGETLALTTTLRQAQQLTRSVQHEWNGVRRDRARPVIEQYQWVAAATAFANPLPSLDLLATGAINAQLLADLGTIYDQPFSLDQAKAATRTFAELMVKLGLVELATQTVAPLLKGHLLTYAAGGVVQGISAAYLTHVAGLSLVQYLEEQSFRENSGAELTWNVDRLGQIMQQVFQTHRRGMFVQNLVNQGLQTLGDRLNPKPSPGVAS